MQNLLKTLTISILVLVGGAQTVMADWWAGVDAYQEKDYDTAMNEFRRMALGDNGQGLIAGLSDTKRSNCGFV